MLVSYNEHWKNSGIDHSHHLSKQVAIDCLINMKTLSVFHTYGDKIKNAKCIIDAIIVYLKTYHKKSSPGI